MSEDARLLGEVSVQGRATRAEQKGDSLMYNAEAFQVMMGSSAEDLLAKMPGIVVEGRYDSGTGRTSTESPGGRKGIL